MIICFRTEEEEPREGDAGLVAGPGHAVVLLDEAAAYINKLTNKHIYIYIYIYRERERHIYS